MNDDVSRVRAIGSQASRRIGSTGWLLLVFVVFLVVAMIATGPEGTLDALRQVGAPGLATLLSLACAHYAIRALRWHVLVRTAGVDTGLTQNVRHFLGGFAMTATPGRIGELVRLRWLKLETGRRFGALVPIAYADRAFELVSMILVIAVALAFASLGTTSALWLLLTGVAISIVACSPRLLTGGIGLVWRLTGRRSTRLFVKLRRMARSLEMFIVPRVVVPVLAIGCLGWFLEGVAFWLLLDWLGAPLSLGAATAIFLSAILLLVLQGVSSDTAVLATLVIRVTTLWFAVAIGFIVFPYAEYRATGSGME